MCKRMVTCDHDSLKSMLYLGLYAYHMEDKFKNNTILVEIASR